MGVLELPGVLDPWLGGKGVHGIVIQGKYMAQYAEFQLEALQAASQ